MKYEKYLKNPMNNEFSFSRIWAKKFNTKKSKMVDPIRGTFTARDKSIFKTLFIAMIYLYLKYENTVLCPFKKNKFSSFNTQQNYVFERKSTF